MSTTARKPNAAPKRVVPNLALAGMKEAANVSGPSTSASPSQNRGRGRGRGGRGGERGRGGRGAHNNKRHDIITEEGIFSKGLYQAPKTKTERSGPDDELPTFAINSLRRDGSTDLKRGVKKDENNGESAVTDGGQANVVGGFSFDEVWASDEEADRAELDEIYDHKSFIADISRGSIAPVVLPETELQQFERMMKLPSSASSSGQQEDDHLDRKEGKPSMSAESALKSEHLRHSTNAARLLGRLRDKSYLGGGAPEMLWLQVPSSLTKLPESQPQEALGENGTGNSGDKTQATPSAAVPAESISEDVKPIIPPRVNPRPPHALAALSGCRGRVRVWNSGRVTLQIDGRELELLQAPRTRQQQTAVVLNCDPAAASSANALLPLAPVPHLLVASEQVVGTIKAAKKRDA